MASNNTNKEELYIVTEQGVFGDLNIQDPSKKKATPEEIERMIKEAHSKNLGE
jgi:hypothetical protein